MDGDKRMVPPITRQQFLTATSRAMWHVRSRHGTYQDKCFSVFHLSKQFDGKKLLHHSPGKSFFSEYNPKSFLCLKEQQCNRVLASVTVSLFPPAICVVKTKCVVAYNLLVCWHFSSAHDLERTMCQSGAWTMCFCHFIGRTCWCRYFHFRVMPCDGQQENIQDTYSLWNKCLSVCSLWFKPWL